MAKKTLKKPLELTDILKLVNEKKLATLGFTSLDIMGPNPIDVIRALNEAGVVVEIGGKAQGRALGSGLTIDEIVEGNEDIVSALIEGRTVREAAGDFLKSPTTVQKIRTAMLDLGYTFDPPDEYVKAQKYLEKNEDIVELLINGLPSEQIATDCHVTIPTVIKVRVRMMLIGYNFSKPKEEQDKAVWDYMPTFE